MATRFPMDCAAADELAPFSVLHALTPDEERAVREHLDSCPNPHPAFAELGGVVPYLAELADPIEAAPALKARVLAAVAAEPQLPAGSSGRGAVVSIHERRTERTESGRSEAEPISLAAERGRRTRGWSTWLAAAAAVLLIGALGAWNVTLQSNANDAARRLAVVRDAIAARELPDAAVAQLAGTDVQPAATGFAAFRPDGSGYIVVSGVAPAPSGRVYQAWYLVSGQPVSAGLMEVTPEGLALLSGLQVPEGTETIALTVEQAGGAQEPTLPIVVAGPLVS